MWTITMSWLDENEVDIDAFMAIMEDENIEGYWNEDDEFCWTFDAADEDGNFIPDFLEGIIDVPLKTNASIGGALTD